ncbi:MAG: cation:proton antiporter [Alphaproteobacteria bacterium]|mgnify:FL=1|jgi:multicomponent Na+:H+ antiporter subunit F|nr:cation:proton antiporter [Alphaproteobacteria bacterium]MBT4020717.1 cation:proton antiporter [Alphaproteobacteria bacterium]MBT4965165.1 cation:proton antiporter [Alphaproteobacteria bacterium]MBT5159650.1 cation:proton antiporter [Alphaproteobacteria bacterium]MBT5917617.1 cation:proton antiporter [Alphaproteobacteria bacterium]
MYTVATLAILVTMALALARAVLGPTVFDRILAVNTIATKTTILIALLGFLTGRPDFLDIALAYALINFIGSIAILKFFKYRDFSRSGWLEPDAPHPHRMPNWMPPEVIEILDNNPDPEKHREGGK